MNVDATDPRAEYERRLRERRAALQSRQRRHTSLGYLRLAVVAAAAALAYLAFARGAISGWWLAAPRAAFLWLGALLESVITAGANLRRAILYYDRALARLDGNWAETGETGARFVDEEHLYAEDLDLFGPASLFQLLCAARTRIGEQTLASWLLAPEPPETVRARQQAIVELAPAIDLREGLAVLAESARSGVHPEALAHWGERPPLLKPSAFRTVSWPLSVVGAGAIAALVVYLGAQGGALDLSPAALTGLRVYFFAAVVVFVPLSLSFARRTNRIIQEVEGAAHDLALLAGVLRRLEAERFESPLLAAMRASLDTEGWPPSRRIARLDRLIDLLDSRHNLLVRMIGPLLLWDIHLSYAIEEWRRASGPAMRRWLDAVGEFEALSSLAAYHYEHPHDVFPEIVEDGPVFDAEAIRHPLLPEDRAVANDISFSDGLQVLIVSGSNMSGKSTLLRTAGVNAVLAQAGAPVRARSLRLSPLAVGASIRVQDSLQAGASRFYAEITRLSRIMRCAAHEPPVLFLIDEVLHGTNSHDRRIGAEAIVRGLVERGAIGMITTHDLALAHIAEPLAPHAANVHFEDHLEDGRIRFDYRMRPGVVQKSNALELMRSVGLDV